MGKRYGQLQEALETLGAKLKRDKKHLVYELPNGRNFVVAQTPSDSRGELNAMSDLRAAAGVEVRDRPKKADADTRAARRNRPGRSMKGDIPIPAAHSPFASALRESGVVEHQLRTRLGVVEAENLFLKTQMELFDTRWFVRLGRWCERMVSRETR